MRRVLIVQWLIKQYRVPFYLQLNEALRADGVELTVAYSDPPPEERGKDDNVELPARLGKKVSALRPGGGTLYQPVLLDALGHDLVIVEQAARHILNYLLMATRTVHPMRLALWGHGWSRRSSTSALPERIKRRTLTWADWWFAYTPETAAYLVERGMPSERVTVVNNSIDTMAFRTSLEEVDALQVDEFRRSIGIRPSDKVGLYCGALYADKKLEFLVEAAHRIRAQIPRFHLVVVGGGEEAGRMRSAAATEGWIHFLGPRFSRDKVLCYRAADLVLNPGLVGLAILDAFSAALPVLTTDIPIHSPEIEYLVTGKNGLITRPVLGDYASAVASLLGTPRALSDLRVAALETSQHYSIERMVEAFRAGVLAALEPSGRGRNAPSSE